MSDAINKLRYLIKAKYTSRKRVGNKWVYTYGSKKESTQSKEYDINSYDTIQKIENKIDELENKYRKTMTMLPEKEGKLLEALDNKWRKMRKEQGIIQKKTQVKSSNISLDNSHIESLSPMNRGKLNSALDKKYRFSDGDVMSMREYINSDNVYGVESKEVPSVTMNRSRYNRMSHSQQEEFDKKYSQKKIDYRLLNKNGSFITIPKMIYDAIKK